MNDQQFNELVDKLQQESFQDAKHAYGEKGFQRWRNPQFYGIMEDADAKGGLTGSCGDSIILYLQFDGNRVTKASYTTDGCGSSSICGSFAAELAVGKNPDEIFDLTGEILLQEIGAFPTEEEHCAYLAVKSLQDAVNNYMIKKTAEKAE